MAQVPLTPPISHRVYPSLVDGVTVTGDVAAWTLGAFAEIIPAATVTDPYAIDAVIVETLGVADIYEVELFHGAGDVSLGSFRVSAAGIVPFPTALIPANDRIRAKAASRSGGGDTLVISLMLHTI